MNKTETFVNAILSGNKEQADRAFKAAISQKTEAALNVARVAVTAEIYNQSANKASK